MSLFGDIHQRIYRGPDDYKGAIKAAAGIVDQVGEVLKSPEGEGVYTDLKKLLTCTKNPNIRRNTSLFKHAESDKREKKTQDTPPASNTIFAFLNNRNIPKEFQDSVESVLNKYMHEAMVLDLGDSEGTGKEIATYYESNTHIQTERDIEGFEEFSRNPLQDISETKGFEDIDHKLVKTDLLEFVTLMKTNGVDCIFINNINTTPLTDERGRDDYLRALCEELVRILPKGQFVIGHEDHPVIKCLKRMLDEKKEEKIFESEELIEIPDNLKSEPSFKDLGKVSLLLKN